MKFWIHLVEKNAKKYCLLSQKFDFSHEHVKVRFTNTFINYVIFKIIRNKLRRENESQYNIKNTIIALIGKKKYQIKLNKIILTLHKVKLEQLMSMKKGCTHL